MSEKRQEKKDHFVQEQKKSGAGKTIAVIAVIAILVATGLFFLGNGNSGGDISVKSVAGEVRIDLEKINDGQAHFFKFAGSKSDIKFFVVKSVDGVIRAAFDTCDVCYREKKGYRQEGEFMVCNNCGQKFRTDMVNEVKGGCNPAPLQRSIDGKQLVINEKDLLNGAWYFGG